MAMYLVCYQSKVDRKINGYISNAPVTHKEAVNTIVKLNQMFCLKNYYFLEQVL